MSAALDYTLPVLYEVKLTGLIVNSRKPVLRWLISHSTLSSHLGSPPDDNRHAVTELCKWHTTLKSSRLLKLMLVPHYNYA